MIWESWITMLAFTLLLIVIAEGSSAEYWEYAVIGAGPAGVQMGYHLQKAGRQYVILERNNVSGSFFMKYPRHGKLISINKRHTGRTNKDFNMRHDWNSILSDNEDLLMRHYSKEFFPTKESLVDYLNDYAKTFDLKVRYNTDVSNISKVWNETQKSNLYHMSDQHGNTFMCKYLIIATGISKPNVPNITMLNFAQGYEDHNVNPLDYEGKHVLILGQGNSAFETADAIYPYASSVHILGRSRVRFAWSTHYVGDLRGVNNNVLDTYQLKSLDGLLEGPFTDDFLQVTKDNETEKVSFNWALQYETDNFALRESYDHIIRCLGFEFDDSFFHESAKPFRGEHRKRKYPLIDDNFEVTDQENMFVAGTAAHSLDYRRAAGGFIHGFRYNVRTLHYILEQKNHQNSWPVDRHPITSLLSVLVKRMNDVDSSYQMFSFLADVILLRNDTFEFVKDFPVNLLDRFEEVTGHTAGSIIVLNMQYGPNFSGPAKDVFYNGRAVGTAHEAYKSNFLHPTLYYYTALPTVEDMHLRRDGWLLPKPNRIHHVVEDFLTDWTGAIAHILPLRRFLQYCTATDLTMFTAEECLELALTHKTVPHTCEHLFLKGQGIILHPDLLEKMKAPELDTETGTNQTVVANKDIPPFNTPESPSRGVDSATSKLPRKTAVSSPTEGGETQTYTKHFTIKYK